MGPYAEYVSDEQRELENRCDNTAEEAWFNPKHYPRRIEGYSFRRAGDVLKVRDRVGIVIGTFPDRFEAASFVADRLVQEQAYNAAY